MIDQTKLIEVSYSDSVPSVCCFDKCHRGINTLDKYFLDILHNKVYCHQCGICLRYARKKAAQRGEPIEKVEIK